MNLKDQLLLIFVLTICSATRAWAFQLYAEEKRIDPSYTDFKYYISSTYYNYSADGQRAITQIHIDGVKKSLAILSEKATAAGIPLTFEYAGTFKQTVDQERNKSTEPNDAFHKTLYFDFTSNELWGRSGAASATADAKRSTLSGSKNAGGVVRLNSDYINFTHPRANMASFIIHEVLHILGLDHSTVSSSVMAYTEFWYPTLSADDILGLQNIYDVGPLTEINVSATLDGSAAKGIEIVAINTQTGVSYVAMTDGEGATSLKHVPYGTYLIGSRELTPTGPCFTDPTRGFLSSFYVNNSSSTNTPSAATALTLADGSVHTLTLVLISGTKRFDCHYGDAVSLSSQACQSEFFEMPTFQEKCYLHMTNTDVRFPLLGENDKSIFHHKTDTDVNSGAHANIVYQPMGTSPGLTFHSYAASADWGNKNYIDLEVLSTAATGTHAALCSEGGEYALISSFIEVQDFGGSLNNTRLLPDLVSAMKSHGKLPSNFGEYVRPGDSQPGVGKRPRNVGKSEEEEKKEWYECGSVVLKSGKSKPVAGLFLLAPVLLVFCLRKKNKSRQS